MVISHERSGTHFLMNAIARGYGYASNPWLDLDYNGIPINYYHPPAIANALEKLAELRIASVVKSHHESEFFDRILNGVLKRYVVFYIHRDPTEVMLSFWRLVHGFPWHEGPKCDDPIAFALAEPEGHLMRYQAHQRRNMLERWATHVEGWYRLSKGRRYMRSVPYAALRDDYAATLSSFSDLLGREPADLTPPERDKNVIRGSTVDHEPDVETLRTRVAEEVGDTMQLLGYTR